MNFWHIMSVNLLTVNQKRFSSPIAMRYKISPTKMNYLTNYVEKMNRGAGLERHDFTHLDCPLSDDSVFFIFGKQIEDKLHITAF